MQIWNGGKQGIEGGITGGEGGGAGDKSFWDNLWLPSLECRGWCCGPVRVTHLQSQLMAWTSLTLLRWGRFRLASPTGRRCPRETWPCSSTWTCSRSPAGPSTSSPRRTTSPSTSSKSPWPKASSRPTSCVTQSYKPLRVLARHCCGVFILFVRLFHPCLLVCWALLSVPLVKSSMVHRSGVSWPSFESCTGARNSLVWGPSINVWPGYDVILPG